MNNFFYDLNKRLATLADKQDAKQISEDVKASAPKSQLAEAVDVAEAGYSAKAGRAGKDLGKPGKNFSKIAKGAAERYGSKAAGERVAGAVLNKLRHPKEDVTDEGNAFTGKLDSTPKGGKFKMGNKEYTDTSDLEEGFKEMDAWLASREKEKGTGKFDKKERTMPGGMKATTYTRKHEDDVEDDKDDSKSKQADKYASPKKKGRPKSAAPKDQERVTKGSHKYKTVDGKRVKKEKTKEDLDSDGVLMTRSTNCSSESIEHGEQAEYNDEAGMTKDSLHTIVRHAKELESALRDNENLPEWVQEKIGQIKGMMSSVTDYIISTHERDAEQQVMPEVAPPGAKAERMVKGIKKSLSKDGHLSGKDKAIAYATTWKARKDGKVEEAGLEKHSTSALKAATGKDRTADQKSGIPANFPTAQLKAELAKRTKGKVDEAGKPDFLDLDKDGDKKEPMKKAAKDKKDEKVDETTVSGSVATATTSGKSSSGGMQFGKGVYEGFNNQVESMITESIDVADTIAENEGKTITVTASGPEADMLMQLLKAAGLSGQSQGCGCGQTPCSCETVDEAYGDTDETLNDPDWPTDTETLAAQPELRTYSGGLNGPKSTGQTTIPVVASQERRLHSESVELERNLFKTWKNYKG